MKPARKTLALPVPAGNGARMLAAGDTPLTNRDLARWHWLNILIEPGTQDPETLAWLSQVAASMLAADRLDPADRREAAYEASGLKGPSNQSEAMLLYLALCDYEATVAVTPEQVGTLTAAEYVAERLGWDAEHGAAPDSLKRRIVRQAQTYGVPAFEEWTRAVLRMKPKPRTKRV